MASVFHYSITIYKEVYFINYYVWVLIGINNTCEVPTSLPISNLFKLRTVKPR